MKDEIALERFFPYRVSRIADAVSQRFCRIYRAQYGLTVPEWRVLATLAQFKLMTAKEIGLHSGMHKTKVSRAIRECEQRRWVRRQVSPIDRRVESLRLTPEGRRAYASMVPKMLVCENDLLNELGRDQSKAVLIAFNKLEAMLGLDTRPTGRHVRSLDN